MFGGLFILAAAVVGEAESDVRGREAGVAPERLRVCRARVARLALLVEGQALHVSLLGARRDFRVRDGARRRFEIRVGVYGQVRAVANQLAPVLALENDGQRFARNTRGQLDCGREGLGRVEVNAIRTHARAFALDCELDLLKWRVGAG